MQTPRDRFAEWPQLLERCGRKPTLKSVHALRVATLRMQVESQRKLDNLPGVSHEAQAIRRFGKVAQKLRDDLAPVRELHVWISKLRRLRESLRETPGYVPRSTRQLILQVERLEDRLKTKRKRAALKLEKKIQRHRQELLRIFRKLEEGNGVRSHEAHANQSAKLAKEFAGIAAEFPVLELSNLHEFRKALKKIRYVAEIDRADPACRTIATQMKKAQDAIGDWHDWELLALLIGRKRHGKDAALADLLGNLASEAAQSAIAVSQATIQHMANLKREQHGEFDHLCKAPVRSERAVPLKSASSLA
ncbi:MAG TPA: CHAD domain-containing protein [Terracidiphilus sp.]|nr:CHAD domain-containing protein [Terracidiphilus sp.]